MYSNITGTLPAGTWVYAQANSYHPAITYGAVLESDEPGRGMPYNNVTGLQLTTPITSSLGAALRQAAPAHRLPSR